MTNPNEAVHMPREELLNLAKQCGMRLTGKPDASEPIEIIFTVQAWRAFDAAIQDATEPPEQTAQGDAELSDDEIKSIARANGHPCEGFYVSFLERDLIWFARRLLLQSPASDAQRDAERYRFLRNSPCWNVNPVRADGLPLSKAEKFAAGFSGNKEGLTAEWDVSFNTDYGLTGDQDNLDEAIDAAIAAQLSLKDST